MYFDKNYMHRALSNLLSNAIKYSEYGGKVTLKMSAIDEQIIIKISDEGLGIAKEDLPHIFERFYRVNHKQTKDIEGTGLGLSIVKTIIEQHDGSIHVKSKFGEGTTFDIILPHLTAHEEATNSVGM